MRDEGDVTQSFGGRLDHCWTDEHFRVSAGDMAQDTMCLRLDFQVVSFRVLVPGMLRFHFKSSLSWRATTSDRSLIRMRNYGLVIVQFPLTRLHTVQGDYNPVRKNGVVQGRHSCVRLRKTKKQTTTFPINRIWYVDRNITHNF